MMLQVRILDDDGVIVRDLRRYFGTDAELRDRAVDAIGWLQAWAGQASVAQLAMESRGVRQRGGGE